MSTFTGTSVVNHSKAEAMKEFYHNAMDDLQTVTGSIMEISPSSKIKVGDKVITGEQLEKYFKILDNIIAEQYPEEII